MISRTLIACLTLTLAPALHAQSVAPSRIHATRSELETIAADYAKQAASATVSAADRSQAATNEQEIRDRLRAGDFRVGDRIVLHVTGDATLFDTLTVTTSRSLRIPDVGDVSVDGVLRSELEPHLTAQFNRLVRNAVVSAEPLTRLAVLGEVRAPGFVHVPSQALLSDVISAAGGPSPTGSLERASVRRGGRVLLSPASFAKALSSGATIDDLDVRAGDEIVIDARRHFNWSQVAQTTAILVGAAGTIIAIQHR